MLPTSGSIVNGVASLSGNKKQPPEEDPLCRTPKGALNHGSLKFLRLRV